jgi:alpha-amylase/alpha-mannosidase (GH57 family)
MRVALLWHMHQPFYRNPVGGEYRMPWTFLHAAKDYYDMLRLAVDGGARVTFNLVPSLVEQLLDYRDPGVEDTFLTPLGAVPGSLNADTRQDLLPRLFFAHLENQIRPLTRYWELHEKVQSRGLRAEALSTQEFQDLEVLFLLAWCGEVVRAEEPVVSGLLAQGRDFTQVQKQELLGVLHALCGRTVTAYATAHAAGQVELSTTPYYHPILPLLLDPGCARVALPDAVLPVLQRGFGDDAGWHVDRALAAHLELFGEAPRGFWPSEGSISGPTLSLLAKRGVAWTASDEDVLAASLGRRLEGTARKALYHPHRYRAADGASIQVFFRDKALSDLIGFSYATWEPEAAAADFVGRLEAIEGAHGADATVSVILDGENAWEFYRANGAPFHRALYRAIAQHPSLEFTTFGERAALADDAAPLTQVHPGSWIYASFSTWVGHAEKNRAWELLERTRCALEDHQQEVDAERRELAWRAIHIAEGSDWFWWLGDDHYSPIAGEFDSLFRLHLLNVYRTLDREPPAELHAPIKGSARHGLLRRPTGLLQTRIDGALSSFQEWLPAGLFDLGYDAGAMHRSDRRLQRLRYGTDGSRLLLCLSAEGGLEQIVGQGLVLEVEVVAEQSLRVRCPLDGGAAEVVEGGIVAVEFAWGRVGEVALPFPDLCASGGVYLALRLLRGDEVLERAPLYHMAKLEFPADPALEAWSA